MNFLATDAQITAVDVVRLLTADPSIEFTVGQLDAIRDAQQFGFVTIADSALRPTLIPGISYCATCLVGCEHETGQSTSCGHAGCWGSEAVADCTGVAFERVALGRMTGHDWQVAESVLAAAALAELYSRSIQTAYSACDQTIAFQ